MTEIYAINPDSATEKTSIAYALSRGYQFKLSDEDGTAAITNPNGRTYHIESWRCECEDALTREGGSYLVGSEGRKMCKHLIWLGQLYPCSNCQGFMILRNEAWKVFQCCTPGCYSMTPFQVVKGQRQTAHRLIEQETDVIKTHQHQNMDDILARAEEASNAIFGDKPVVQAKFESRFGIYIKCDVGLWKVYCAGFLDSTHKTEALAKERAERLEVLEESHQSRGRRANYA